VLLCEWAVGETETEAEEKLRACLPETGGRVTCCIYGALNRLPDARRFGRRKRERMVRLLVDKSWRL
jgi:hypothetical protein